MDFDDAILELESAILEATGMIEEDLTVDLKALSAEILGEMIQGRFQNRTGALRNSMFAVVDGTTLRLGMLYYGYFLSFGVLPRQAEGLPVEVAPQFGVQEGYKFARRGDSGRFKKGGITAKGFYPTDLDSRIEQIINDVIQKVEL